MTAQPVPFGFNFSGFALAHCQFRNVPFARHLLSVHQKALACYFQGLLVLLFLCRQVRISSLYIAVISRETSNYSGCVPHLRFTRDIAQGIADSFIFPARSDLFNRDAEPFDICRGLQIDPGDSSFGQWLPRCPICDSASTKSCHHCDQDFCCAHLYSCPECYTHLCGACLEDHFADGHWSDSETSAELSRSQS
jgi:hypothetical protein